MLIDLHCHSSLSDGEYLPEQVGQEMAAAGVRFAALTDHNTTAGLERFQVVLAQLGVGFLTGAELSVYSPAGPLHLLAYGIDPQHARLQAALHVIRNPVGWYMGQWKEQARARIFRKPPVVSSFAADISGLHFERGRLDFGDAVRLIHQAGGIAILAHPVTRISIEQLTSLLPELQEMGLDGIEAFYQPYPEETQQRLLALAESHQLLVSAGSDYHGPHSHHASHPGMEMPENFLRPFFDTVRLGGCPGGAPLKNWDEWKE